MDDADDVALQYAFESNIVSRLQTWNPDIILISAGYDAVKGDDLAGMLVTPHQFRRFTAALMSLGKPVLAVLEGGYNPELLGLCVKETVLGLLGESCQTLSEPVKEDHKACVDTAK